MRKSFCLGTAIFGLLMLVFAGAGCGSDPADVLECEGDCSCDEQERSCTCQGGTDCAIDGASDVTFYCDGNASCDLKCGAECHVVCPGTTQCAATLGPAGSAECQGTASCEYTCDADCDIECGGNTDCSIECHDDCERDGDACVC